MGRIVVNGRLDRQVDANTINTEFRVSGSDNNGGCESIVGRDILSFVHV